MEDVSAILVPMIDFKSELNAEQLQVVENAYGPTLVLAGAGSGKTRTITYRVAYLLQKGVQPSNILLVTFTNKAAREMILRLEHLLGSTSGGLWAGTFHSIANRLLRLYAPLLGFHSNFTILDSDDSTSLIKVCIKEAHISTQGRRFPSPRVVQAMVSLSRNAFLALPQIIEDRYVSFTERTLELVDVAERYAAKKRESHAMDFDDLLVHLHTLLVNEPRVEERLSEQFRYILVDEYQDTNALQANIVNRLASKHRNILVVGDDAQSIYSFRGADIQNILGFESLFTSCKTFRLTTNYRSTPEILQLANASIARNVSQYKKSLTAVRDSGEAPGVVMARSAREEAAFILQQVDCLLSGGMSPREVVVLFRATYQSQTLEFELMKAGVAYEYRGGMRFFERAHVKDVLAYVRAIENPKDTAAWLRLLGLQQGIGLVSAQKIVTALHAIVGDEPHLTSAHLVALGKQVSGRSCAGFEVAAETLKVALAEPMLSEQISRIIKVSYLEYLESEYPNASDRLEDLHQLEQFAISYEGNRQLFLEEVTLGDEFANGANVGVRPEDRIVLSTIHQAKGLEWDTVFVMGLCDGQFPNHRAMSEEDGLEEERRLFYVAVTRAKRSLYLTYSTTGSGRSMEMMVPSMFLEEVPKDLVNEVGRTHMRALSHGTPSFMNEASDFNEPMIVLNSDGERQSVTSHSFLKDITDL